MLGGMDAWDGFVAEGAPEAGTAYFTAAHGPGELIALAWVLEEGSRRFYDEVAVLVNDEDAKKLFRDLSNAEEHHKTSLIHLYETFSGTEPGGEFPGSVLALESGEDIMEGGMRVNETLKWAKGKNARTIVELALALETNAYDLYIKMRLKMEDDTSRQVFDQLSREEKKHLELLARLFERIQ